MATPYACFYGTPRSIQPKFTECLLCKRTILTKDIKSHWSSKMHKVNEEKRKADEKIAKTIAVYQSEDPFPDSLRDTFPESTSAAAYEEARSWDAAVAQENAEGYGNSGDNNGASFDGGEWSLTAGRANHDRSGVGAAKGRGNGCFNCGVEGHRANMCPNPKTGGGDTRLCYNCNLPGHNKADCLQEAAPSRGNDTSTCFNCHGVGHRKADCPNPRVFLCNNCDQPGHKASECPDPKDWSRVICNNCGNSGHTVKRCQQPLKEPEPISGEWEVIDNGDGNGDGAATGEWAGDAAGDVAGDWSTGW